MSEPKRRETDRTSSHWDYVALAVLSILARIPFYRFHDLVTFDGTYYLREAKALMHFEQLPGSFPLGYPAVVAVFQVVLRDWVLAGRMVSMLAAVATTLLVYHLLRDRTGRLIALVAATILSFNPLFIRVSLETLSEPLYIFFVMLSLVFLVDRRHLLAGLTLGAATATRPEGLAIVAVAAVLTLKRPRQLAMMLAAFAVVYVVNVAVFSSLHGQLELLSKATWLGSATEDWVARESTIDFDMPGGAENPMTEATPQRGVIEDYLYNMPRELGLLLRHTWPLLLIAAAWGIWKTGWHVFLAPLASLLVFTLFTKRQEHRYLLPYVPPLVIYAGLGVAALPRKTRTVALGLLGASVVVMLFVERPLMTTPEETGLESLKQAGVVMSDVIEPTDRVADRKPHLPFYAGARYVEIPVAPYDDTIAHLAADGVEWLSLHQKTIHPMRPALRPLMYSRSVINGELRYEQVFYQPAGEMVFQLSRNRDPLEWAQMTAASKSDIMPAWSPDGERIAFRRQRDDETVSLVIASRRNRTMAWTEDNIELMEVAPLDDARDPLAWSPDGERIAFARRNTGERTDLDLFAVDVYSRQVELLVSDPLDDRSPSWPSTNRIIFGRETPNRADLWSRDLAAGREEQLSDAGNCIYPVVSPDGTRVAWGEQGGGIRLLELESGAITKLPAPRGVVYAPTWSPDGQTIAVSANDWGNYDVYMVRTDGTSALLLTKLISGEASPAWSPDGRSMVVVSNRSDRFSLWMLTGLEPYLERFDDPVLMHVFIPPTKGTD